MSQESESEEDGIHVDSQKALALKEKVLFGLALGFFRWAGRIENHVDPRISST